MREYDPDADLQLKRVAQFIAKLQFMHDEQILELVMLLRQEAKLATTSLSDRLPIAAIAHIVHQYLLVRRAGL